MWTESVKSAPLGRLSVLVDVSTPPPTITTVAAAVTSALAMHAAAAVAAASMLTGFHYGAWILPKGHAGAELFRRYMPVIWRAKRRRWGGCPPHLTLLRCQY